MFSSSIYFLGRVSNAPSVVGEYEVAIEFTSGATIANGDVWVLGRAEGTDGPDALRNNDSQLIPKFLIMEMMLINYSKA